MQQRSGVPLIADLDQLKADPYYAEITGFSRDFLARHADALAGYGRLWGQDPFMLWSRRWEYPFAAQKTIEYGKTHPGPIKVLDAGSGVTFFPYYVCEHLPRRRWFALTATRPIRRCLTRSTNPRRAHGQFHERHVAKAGHAE